MHQQRLIASAMFLVACATALGAQGRAPGGPGQPPFGGSANALGATAEFLLSHTGDLRLSDNQVVRLASIARRSADRRRAMRDSLEDLRPSKRAPMRGDSVDRDDRRREFQRNAEQMRTRVERMREQVEDERRDAIAVLNVDQQAQAWEMVVAGGRGRGSMGDAPFARGRGRGGQAPGAPNGSRVRRPPGETDQRS